LNAVALDFGRANKWASEIASGKPALVYVVVDVKLK